jgi:putative membrane protein insertion efficiency factor
VLGRILIGVIRVYQIGVSPWTPASCRFTPPCSVYAIEAIRTHGAARGGWLMLSVWAAAIRGVASGSIRSHLASTRLNRGTALRAASYELE